MRFQNPVPGNWIMRIYNNNNQNSNFHIWLPAKEILAEDVTFLKPDPDTTLTVPSDAESAISMGFYNGFTDGIVSESGRGFTRTLRYKPEITAPGIQVTVPKPNKLQNTSLPQTDLYGSMSGSSTAAALTAGGMALLQQWKYESAVSSFIDAANMKAYIIRGANREYGLLYPNPITGYGKLDLYGIFKTLLS